MINWAQILTVANLVILVVTVGGGYFVLRSTIAKAEIDVQERVRQALHDENELLQSQVERQEKEIKRMRAIFDLLVSMLKRMHGIEIEINGDMVSIHSANGQTSSKIKEE